MKSIKRNVLLNPGPATTTDTVKYAQVIEDICPREKDFVNIMRELSEDLTRIVHGDLDEFVTVLFCGSGTINIDSCLSSLVPDGKKVLILNNGAYSERGRQVCEAYHIDHINISFPVTLPLDQTAVEKALADNPDIGVVYACHHETGTGVLNPVREIGAIVHQYGATFIVDTTSSYAMMPIDIEKDNMDFIMSSAQKGIAAMTGLSYVVGRKSLIEKSKEYTTRSFYTNLYMQYKNQVTKGEMRFTPPVQTVFAARQAIKEYYAEGEIKKWERHKRVYNAIYQGLDHLGFKTIINKNHQSQLVVSVLYPNDNNWDFTTIHDYCYDRGYVIYPGKVTELDTFRLCCFGVIDEKDIANFFSIFESGLKQMGVTTPVKY